MSGNPWWTEFRGSCSLTLPSLHLERRQTTACWEEIPWLSVKKAWYAEITVYQRQGPAALMLSQNWRWRSGFGADPSSHREVILNSIHGNFFFRVAGDILV